MPRSNPRVLRLVAYNIFGFRKGSPSQLAAYLKSLMPIDVLCLNEVSIKDRRLDQLTRHLGEEYKSFFFSTTANKNPEFGNAVITRLPIIRNGVLVDFDDFSVCCTHLDHMRENERVKQVDGLIEQLRERLCPETPHFIMGDFNELSSEDYTTDEWSNLKQRHENFGWPFESDEVTERLLRADYVDVLRSCGDLRKTAHTQEDTPLYRIDYAWASAAAIGRVKNGFVHCGEEVEKSKFCSDHFAVVVDAAV
ncbi:hypothetical protein FOZ60_004129 [Perkinsus olseni]|uniref:Endonuclease/exonuclease/phosphatase domain-containing protein n=1 Tax=Perkinsus olseni TaxID=32597 RepID=A0A7J6NTV4_PEROL|nr:hypothetical protein FOZ60_004129 [Perkinsus olseni]